MAKPLKSALLSFVIALLLAPASAAIPDPGISRSMDQIVADNPWMATALPCHERGVVWNGLGVPAVDSALRTAGSDLCEAMALEAAITFVTHVGVSGQVTEDGELTLRIVFPLIETPLLTPFRNQNPDSPTFGADAARDAAAPLAQWVPTMLDPNADVPCTAGSTGVPRATYLHVEGTPGGAAIDACGDAGAAAGVPFDSPNNIQIGSDMTVAPPRKVATVQRLFLVRITGLAVGGPNVQPVYDAALLNVAMVNNVATETLNDIRTEVERNGQSLQNTVFEIKAYATEAAFAVGDALLAYAPVQVPELSDKPLITVDLPDAPGPLAAAADAGAQAAAECRPSETGNLVVITESNGCVSTELKVYESDKGLRTVDHWYERNLGDGEAFWAERIGGSTWFELPPKAGLRRVTQVMPSVETTHRFKFTTDDPFIVHAVWKVRGDVRRLCDSSNTHCMAYGADMWLDTTVRHQSSPAGSAIDIVGQRHDSLLPSAPLEWCGPEIPLAPDLYDLISTAYCFIKDVRDGFKHEVDAMSERYYVQSIPVDPDQYPGWIEMSSAYTARVHSTSMTNIPDFDDMRVVFGGFVVEAV